MSQYKPDTKLIMKCNTSDFQELKILSKEKKRGRKVKLLPPGLSDRAVRSGEDKYDKHFECVPQNFE